MEDQKTAPILQRKSSNKEELLKIFQKIIPDQSWRLLEVGTGSGHHAVHISAKLKHLQWVTSDLPVRHSAIKKTLQAAALPNVHGPLAYEVGKDDFPKQKLNAVFASQLLHTISWKQAKTLIKALGNRLREGSQVLLYGPFSYGDSINTAPNIRSFENILKAMNNSGFALKKDFTLEGNNHLLYFVRLKHE
ncbi:MAG: DUF938 domain-containing protein [Bdellovibrionota bacterium]